jgi:putative endonuclease
VSFGEVAAVDGSVVLGRIGERIAADYLQLAGCAILERNFRFERVEIDLIVRDGACVVFVEVKMRRSTAYGGAREAVSPQKLRNLRKAARWYLCSAQSAPRADEYRFDLVALDIDRARNIMVVRHLKGIA